MNTQDPSPAPDDVTILIQKVQGGDSDAANSLLPVLHDQLHRVARSLMKGESSEHTLQPTALIHEAYIKLFENNQDRSYENRRHFLRVAARAMRQVLLDHARAKKTEKRGGERAKVPMDAVVHQLAEKANIESLKDALDALTEMDPELAELVDLRFFSQFTIDETAELLGVSTPTVERRWRIARAWLEEKLKEE